MNENDMKALAHALIADCSADTLAALQKAIQGAQADSSGATLNQLLTVSTIAVEINADRATQETKKPAELPKTLAEAIELDRAKKAARK